MGEQKKRYELEFIADRYRLMAFIHGMVKDHHVAEDVFQEVWLKLAAATEQGVVIENTSAWSRGVARNLILHYWRGRKKSEILVDEELLNMVEMAFEEQDSRQEYWHAREQALRYCLRKVPLRSQRILAMKYEKGLSVAVIAKRLGKTVAAITQLLYRLREKLCECAERAIRLQETEA